jgi:hypothetical protein
VVMLAKKRLTVKSCWKVKNRGFNQSGSIQQSSRRSQQCLVDYHGHLSRPMKQHTPSWQTPKLSAERDQETTTQGQTAR